MAISTIPAAVKREVQLLLAVGLAVQLLVPYRHDLPAHLVSGGGLMILVIATLSTASDWAGHKLTAASIALSVGITWVAERVLMGPFDAVDLAFSLGGMVVVLDGVDQVVSGSDRDRKAAQVVAAAVVAGALVYRYRMAAGA